jgi:tyrosyl-tRNA synthetase
MKPTKVTFPPVKEQMDRLLRGASEIISPEDLERKLQRSSTTGVPLRVKQGFDPSAPDLHIGHAVPIRKLRQFQQLGHTVIFLIGDFTGMVGDPSGKSKTRPRLTREDVERNAETYKQQVFKILDPATTEIRFNSEWHGSRDIYKFLELTGKHTVARMLERDDFLKRYQAGEAISLLEFLYPLLQAYDSVALKADVELGGTDQKYNLLLGRKIQEEYGLEAQVVFMMPILTGTDGKDKMSKSLGNYVSINDPPDEIYGRVMSIPDSLILDYFTLATDVPASEISQIKSDLAAGQINPMEHKKRLAREITALYQSPEAAAKAQENFHTRFQTGGVPEDVLEVMVPAGMTITDLLMATGSTASKSEARRKIEEGAVHLDDQKITDFRLIPELQDNQILKVGKRKIFRLKLGNR